jgi:DHA2 family multidrug resistance protein
MTQSSNSPDSSQTPAEYPPLAGGQLLVATIVVALATFMSVLDTSIANVAIPTIAGNLGVSVDEGTWVITIFAAANAISIPLTGWFAQRIGQTRLFVGSILMFVLASWLCGIAPSLPFLIAARIVQGVVAGPLIPLSQSILMNSYPRAKAGMALALWVMVATVGPIAGPILGGWITDSYSWSWIFYVNIPVGLVAAAVTWRIYRRRETQTKRLPIDVVGLLLLVAWVGSLQVMLDKGKDLDWFASPFIIELGIAALVTFALFLIWELTEENPIVDLRLFALCNFSGGTVALSVAYAVYFGNLVLLPQWMQGYLGYPAFDAGLVTAPVGIIPVILSPLMGRVLDRIDPRIVATVAFVAFAGVFWMRAQYANDIDTFHLVLPTFLQGLPSVLFFVPLVSIILSGLPPERIPAAAGLSNFARVFCGAVGTSISSTVWNNRTILHHVRLTEQASINNPVFSNAIESIQEQFHTSVDSALALFDLTVTRQAAVMGLMTSFTFPHLYSSSSFRSYG